MSGSGTNGHSDCSARSLLEAQPERSSAGHRQQSLAKSLANHGEAPGSFRGTHSQKFPGIIPCEAGLVGLSRVHFVRLSDAYCRVLFSRFFLTLTPWPFTTAAWSGLRSALKPSKGFPHLSRSYPHRYLVHDELLIRVLAAHCTEKIELLFRQSTHPVLFSFTVNSARIMFRI